MAGTKEAALKTTQKILANDPDFFRRIGSVGGKKERSAPRGFAAMSPEQRKAAGRIGGSRSKRGKSSDSKQEG